MGGTFAIACFDVDVRWPSLRPKAGHNFHFTHSTEYEKRWRYLYPADRQPALLPRPANAAVACRTPDHGRSTIVSSPGSSGDSVRAVQERMVAGGLHEGVPYTDLRVRIQRSDSSPRRTY